jgi:hypothetical protein
MGVISFAESEAVKEERFIIYIFIFVHNYIMDEIINGFPAYMYPMCLAFQFMIFPLMTVFNTVFVYNITFTAFLLKDYFYEIDYILSAHHVLALFYLWLICKTRREMLAYTIAEVGSGVYNLYTLARYYQFYVPQVHVLYFVIMTLSNLYIADYMRTSNRSIYLKLPMYLLIAGREYFIFL